jgi:transposase
MRRGLHRAWSGVLLLDRAGWHTTGELKVPNNITLLFLPSRAPELNPLENLWQFLRQTYLSNRTVETSQDILDGACEAWNCIIDQPWRIMSIGLRQWAHNGQSL